MVLFIIFPHRRGKEVRISSPLEGEDKDEGGENL
jgi:hypothetical protein